MMYNLTSHMHILPNKSCFIVYVSNAGSHFKITWPAKYYKLYLDTLSDKIIQKLSLG